MWDNVEKNIDIGVQALRWLWGTGFEVILEDKLNGLWLVCRASHIRMCHVGVT